MQCVNRSRCSAASLALLFFLFALPGMAQGAIGSIEEAVNKASKQRMLTQRMLAMYALAGMGVKYGDPVQELGKLRSLFSQQVNDLKAFPMNDQVTASLNRVEALWRPIDSVLAAPPESGRIADLRNAMEELLKACHESTGLIIEASGDKGNEIIGVSGRQRMLSQRLSALYMMEVWGIRIPEFHDELLNTMNEFGSAHAKLMASPLSTDEIKKKLSLVKKNFFWFEFMAKSDSDKYVPYLIAKSADRILVAMDEITGLYVKNSKD